MTMQTLSPSADRIGGALEALRRLQSQNGNSEDKLSRGAQCLRVLVDQFTEEGVPQEDLQPLVELEALLQTLREQPQGH
jgi:hypothetical protein